MPETRAHLMLPVLADAMAAACDPVVARPAVPTAASRCGLWAHDAVDELSTPTYSRLYIWGGEDADVTPERVAIQCFTVGPDHASAAAQAANLHDVLLDTEGVPRLHWRPEVGGVPIAYELSVFELSRPRAIGRDEKNRVEVSFDFEIGFIAA
jgi:hypothetical protein